MNHEKAKEAADEFLSQFCIAPGSPHWLAGKRDFLAGHASRDAEIAALEHALGVVTKAFEKLYLAADEISIIDHDTEEKRAIIEYALLIDLFQETMRARETLAAIERGGKNPAPREGEGNDST